MHKYRIYCQTDGWVEVIASVEPTQCPIDSNHTVTANSVAVLEMDVYINDGSHTDLSLDDYKKLRYAEIDSRTGELVSQGFTYQAKVFSLSQNAQINILALDETRDDPVLTYPISYNTIDDMDSYSVVDSTDLHNMYLTALATKKGHIDSGTTLKNDIRNAANTSEVDAIIDNR
jgi:hypothetical protein